MRQPRIDYDLAFDVLFRQRERLVTRPPVENSLLTARPFV